MLAIGMVYGLQSGMDSRRLEAFRKVYELGSFSRAGEAIFLSQPTVSAHVASLEAELGARLFDRLGRSVKPTAAGEVLYRHAHAAALSLERAVSEVHRLANQVAGPLALGASSIPTHHLLPEAVAAFTAAHPEVRITLRVGDTDEVLDLLAGAEVDLAVVGARRAQAELAFTPLWRDELVLLAAPALLQDRNTVGAASLADLPWVMREEGSGSRRALEDALRAAGIDPRGLRVALETPTTLAQLAYAAAGMGVAAASRLAARPYLDQGRLRELAGTGLGLARTIFAARRERRELFPVARAFWGFLEERAASDKTALSGEAQA